MPTISSTEKISLLIQGADESRPLYFYVVAGIDFDEGSIPVLTATGIPERDHFPSVNPAEDPNQFREAIMNMNIRLNEENRDFYKITVENEIGDLLTDNLDRIRQLLEENAAVSELKELIHEKLSDFQATELELEIASYDEVLFEENDANLDGEENEEDSSSPSGGLEVTPVIDVNKGVPVEKLSEGEEIIVKFLEDTIEQYNLSEEYRDAHLRARFKSFRTQEDEPEGELSVELQEGILGVAEVSRGSLIKTLPQESDEDEGSNYETRITGFVLTMSVLLVFLAFISILTIL